MVNSYNPLYNVDVLTHQSANPDADVPWSLLKYTSTLLNHQCTAHPLVYTADAELRFVEVLHWSASTLSLKFNSLALGQL